MAGLNKSGSFDKARIRPQDISKDDKDWTIGGLTIDADEMKFKTGAAEVFSVTSTGAVSKGKAEVQKTQNESGLILYSPSKKWKVEVSDTGQLVTTELV